MLCVTANLTTRSKLGQILLTYWIAVYANKLAMIWKQTAGTDIQVNNL